MNNCEAVKLSNVDEDYYDMQRRSHEKVRNVCIMHINNIMMVHDNM